MNDNAFNFQTLHPDTIMDALFEQGIRVDSGLTPLNSYENRVYQFQDEDRRRFVVKFYRPERWSVDQIQEEHQFALELVSDEVPVAAPLVFSGQTLLSHQGFHYAIFPASVDVSLKPTTSIRWRRWGAISGVCTRPDASVLLPSAQRSALKNT